jgi:hypothetical protein
MSGVGQEFLLVSTILEDVDEVVPPVIDLLSTLVIISV